MGSFDNLSEYSSAFPRVDSAFICLGTTRAKAGAEGFVKVDHDYVVEASKLLHNSGCPDLHLLTSQVLLFCHLKERGHGFNTDVCGHSQGSNPDSFFLYPSTKGKA